MALLVDSEMPSNLGVGQDGATGGTLSFAFVNTAGTLLIAIVGVGAPTTDATDIGAVTYGGQTMTNLLEISTSGSPTASGRMALYYLVNPPIGSNTFSMVWTGGSGTCSSWGGLISYTGADLVNSFKQQSSGNDGGSLGSSKTVTQSGVVSGNQNLVACGFGTAMNSNDQTLSWGLNRSEGGSLGNCRMTRSTDSPTASHTFGTPFSDHYAWIAVEIQAPTTLQSPAPGLHAGRFGPF